MKNPVNDAGLSLIPEYLYEMAGLHNRIVKINKKIGELEDNIVRELKSAKEQGYTDEEILQIIQK